MLHAGGRIGDGDIAMYKRKLHFIADSTLVRKQSEEDNFAGKQMENAYLASCLANVCR
jgi:hypothetical protein